MEIRFPLTPLLKKIILRILEDDIKSSAPEELLNVAISDKICYPILFLLHIKKGACTELDSRLLSDQVVHPDLSWKKVRKYFIYRLPQRDTYDIENDK